MFTDYINRFLDLVDRFVSAYEVRNRILDEQKAVSGSEKSQRETAASSESVQESKADAANESSADESRETTGRRSRSRAGSAGAESQSEGETTGRRSRQRASSNEETQQDETPASGRRSRSRSAGNSEPQQEEKKPDPVKDTPEQADARAEVEHLCQLAGDVDDCAKAVKDYFLDKGWKTATDVPGDALLDVQDDLNDIIDKYFD